MAEFGKSLDVMVQQNQYTTGFAVIETTGLRIGANGSLKNVNVMMLNDIFSAVRNIIDITNDLFCDPNEQNTTTDAYAEVTDEGKPDDLGPNINQIDEVEDSEEGDDEEEEEEEFKIIIDTKDKKRLVLCTCEGICCGMLQVAPYCGPGTEQQDNQPQANGTTDDHKVNYE